MVRKGGEGDGEGGVLWLGMVRVAAVINVFLALLIIINKLCDSH